MTEYMDILGLRVSHIGQVGFFLVRIFNEVTDTTVAFPSSYIGNNVDLGLGQYERGKGEKASPMRENKGARNWHVNSSIPGPNFFQAEQHFLSFTFSSSHKTLQLILFLL